MQLIIVSIIDDKFNKWSTSDTAKEIIYLFYESTEFLEKIFKKPIAEIRSVEGNYSSYPERQTDTKKRREKGEKVRKVLKTSHYFINYC